MKQKDIALYIVVAFISALTAFFISSRLIVSPSDRQRKVEVIEAISSDFNAPSETYFNDQSINPTQNSTAGQSTNETPFNSTSQ